MDQETNPCGLLCGFYQVIISSRPGTSNWRMSTVKKSRRHLFIFAEQPLILRTMRFAGWALLFGVAYAQSPLYTSNQNQYFLHGLARAGLGFLAYDWLALTLDPTPVFSLLVWITYRLFAAQWIYYLFYIVLMGIYLYSLFGIVRLAFAVDRPSTRLIFMTLLVLVHSAALRFALSRAIGDPWTFVLEGGVAGQRVLGVVFQPSAFGVLLVLSIYLFLSGRYALAIVSAVAAAYFHPTYLLSAGILVCTYLVIVLARGEERRKVPWMAAAAFLLVLPVLFYVYRSFGGASEAVRRAQEILVNFRIPHHALITEWLDITTLAQMLLLIGGLWIARRTVVFPLLAIASALAFLLTLVQLISRNNALALVFPWRISVILIPIAVALWLGFLVERLAQRLDDSGSSRLSLIIRVLCWICLAGLAAAGVFRFWVESNEKILVKEYPLYQFVRQTKSARDVYLIPTKMQDFRLETGAPVYIDFKSIPYQSAEVLEWYRRNLFADSILEQKTIDCSEIGSVRGEGVSHLVVESGVKVESCSGIRAIYQDEYFSIYQLMQ